MALLDFLKNKEEKEKAKEKKAAPKAVKNSVTKEAKKAEVKTEAAPSKKETKVSTAFSYSTVKEPHISEKANILGEENKYVFKVYNNANKPEIKKSIEGIYGVNVLAVNVIKIPRKKRRLGKTQGFKKAYNKAIVTIKKGQKIEIF